MKTLIASIAFALCATAAHADTVNGHFRKNGTYVESYQRSNRNNTTLDNYSTRGNVNPYTGKQGTQNPYGLERPNNGTLGCGYSC